MSERQLTRDQAYDQAVAHHKRWGHKIDGDTRGFRCMHCGWHRTFWVKPYSAEHPYGHDLQWADTDVRGTAPPRFGRRGS